MSAASTPAARQLADEQLAALRRLLEVGLKLAEALQADVTAAVTGVSEERAALKDAAGQDVWIPLAPAPVFTGDVALAYARISRAVRLTLAMQTRVLRGLEPGRREDAAPQPARPRDASAALTDSDTESPERLTDRDDLDALLELPFDEAVAVICDDLRLASAHAATADAGEACEDRAAPNAPADVRMAIHPTAPHRPIVAANPSPARPPPRRNRSP
jgi:hypothetical protein